MTALTALSWKSLNNATVVSSTQAYMLLATTRVVSAAVLRTSRIPYAAARLALSLEPNDSGDAESPGTGAAALRHACTYLERKHILRCHNIIGPWASKYGTMRLLMMLAYNRAIGVPLPPACWLAV